MSKPDNKTPPEKESSEKPSAEKKPVEKKPAGKPDKAKSAEKKATDKSVVEARKALHATENYSYQTPLLVLSILFLLVWGLQTREHEYLTAESGLGYALGIIGGSMMLLLLLYPVRKKMMVGKYMGSVPGWFKFHMFCGVFGPIAVLYHSNFSFGSLNSSVALMCMIIVASSGLVGRYFYSKIHYGLYGQKASLNELNQIVDSEEDQLSMAYKLIPDISNTLKEYHKEASVRLNVIDSIGRFFVLGFKLRLASLMLPFALKKILKEKAQEHSWSKEQTDKNYLILKTHIRSFLHAVTKTCEFSIYERLFALWHLLHYPLFLMLVISGIVHVFAVHMY